VGYDVLIIGSGVGGYNAAIRAGQLGLKVGCIEKDPDLGGVCLNIGCIPSKSLLHASEVFESARLEFTNLGVEVQPHLNLDRMQKQKQESVAALRRGIEFLFRKNHVDRINGTATFDGPGRLRLIASGGGASALEARDIVIATGSTPATVPGVVIDQKNVIDSEGALALTSPPRRMLVLGAGAVGLELGSVW
jgi:dihydrolipoamide dehydrogenase